MGIRLAVARYQPDLSPKLGLECSTLAFRSCLQPRSCYPLSKDTRIPDGHNAGAVLGLALNTRSNDSVK